MDPRRTVDVTDTSVVNPYRTAFHQSDVGLALVDRGGRVIDANAAFLALVAASNVPSPPSLVGTPLSRVLPGLEAALGTRAPLTTTIPVGDTDARCDVQPLSNGDEWLLIRLTRAVRPDVVGDPLTGLANRAQLLTAVGRALARRQRAGCRVQLLVVDVDDFKLVNDRYGHLAGDRVLCEIASRLVALVRPTDTVARWGGDEFVVLLEDPAQDAASVVSERVEAAVGAIALDEATTIPVQVSCGWVEADDTDDPVGLLHRADLRMYEIKRARKRARGASESELAQRLHRASAWAAELTRVAVDMQAQLRRGRTDLPPAPPTGAGASRHDPGIEPRWPVPAPDAPACDPSAPDAQERAV